MSNWHFIATEFLNVSGEHGERRIWEAVIKAFKGSGDGMGFLNYTDYNHAQQSRVQPDILLVDRDLGLTVIEVKSCRIDQIVAVQGNQWVMQKFYSSTLTPLKQAEYQVRQILKRCDRHANLKGKVQMRIMVALPMITREEWITRGFEVAEGVVPPILFADELSAAAVVNAVEYRAIILNWVVRGGDLNDEQWLTLQETILGLKSNTKRQKRDEPIFEVSAITPSRSEALLKLRSWLYDIDVQQVNIALQIPPGPQRIRGIAGSGKTMLLCQKAARMHLQHPEWDIALVFFSRSLYDLIPQLIRECLTYYQGEQFVEPDFQQGKLKVLHAWGDKTKPGLYSILRNANGGTVLTDEKVIGTMPERLAVGCKRLMQTQAIQPQFDAILVDEGQDLATGADLKYQDKQAIYWLAWLSLRPIPDADPTYRRLIWTYDEAQSLETLVIPTYEEVFGPELGAIVSGAINGPNYPGGIQKNEIMRSCYRTPGPILMAAHALGMGLLRPEGMLSGFTTKKGWEDIGYNVRGDFRRSTTPIVLHRPPENSPHPLPKIWTGPLLEFEVYPNAAAQCHEVVQHIRHNLAVEGLNPSRDILVLVLSNPNDETKGLALQRRLANTLYEHGLHYYLPGAKSCDQVPSSSASPYGAKRDADHLWYDQAITIAKLYSAKGHEAPMVYIIGLEALALDESNLKVRNQLFTAMSRSNAWVHMSGICDPHTQSEYLFYDEVRQVIHSQQQLEFYYRRPPKRLLNDGLELEESQGPRKVIPPPKRS